MTVPKRARAAPKRPRGRPRTSPRGGELSPASIRAAALALIDREGLDEFSTRKLGQALRCEAMAIYWYYANKDALLDAVVDELVAGMSRTLERTPADWVDALRELARAYRAIAHAHPRAFPLLATRRFATPGTFAFMEALFAAARRQGLPDRTTARFYRVVSSYCSGFALNELATLAPGTAALRRQFPHVADVSELLEPRHLDDIFEFGLALLLDALAREVGSVRR